jgi:hypothetical protein
MRNLIEKVVLEEIRSEVRGAVKSYFASLLELQKGPVFQTHSAMTRNGLTKSVRKTKRSQLADMKRGEEYFFPVPKGVDVGRWTDRWSSAIDSMQKKTGFKWTTHRDRENGGAVIVRTR